jgi:hypothetical protein
MTFAQAIEAEYRTYGPLQRRYIEAARRLWHDDGQIEIDTQCVVSESADDGAYVMAWVWVPDDELKPCYSVWIAEPPSPSSPVRAPGIGASGWRWGHEEDFTCADDPDGRGARAAAHDRARYLRSTYPCAFVAVRPAGKPPLSIHQSCE